jgi:hypothetical protein
MQIATGHWSDSVGAITDEIEHPYEWMRTEHADLWLGFSSDQVEGFFGDARLQHYGYAPLGTQ